MATFRCYGEHDAVEPHRSLGYSQLQLETDTAQTGLGESVSTNLAVALGERTGSVQSSEVSPQSHFGAVGKGSVFHLPRPLPVASSPDHFFIGSEGEEEQEGDEEEKEEKNQARKGKEKKEEKNPTRKAGKEEKGGLCT